MDESVTRPINTATWKSTRVDEKIRNINQFLSGIFLSHSHGEWVFTNNYYNNL